MNLSFLILSIGSLLGFAGLFSLISSGKHQKMRTIAVLVVTTIMVLPVTHLLSAIPLVCDQGGQALLMMGAQAQGANLPHTGVIQLTTTWSVFTILQWATLAIAAMAALILLVSQNVRHPGWIALFIGVVWLLFAVTGLAGLIGHHLDKTALTTLATYGGLAHITNSIEAFQPTLNCSSGAHLSARLFLFSGGLGMLNLIGGMSGFKRNREGIFQPVLMAGMVYIILLAVAFQFLHFSNFIKIFSLLSLISGIAAMIERDRAFASALGAVSFGLLLLLPFV